MSPIDRWYRLRSSATFLFNTVIPKGSHFDGTVLTVTMGRDGKTVVKMSKWNRGPFPSTISPTVDSYRPVQPRKLLPLYFAVRPIQKICPYRPIPPSKPAPTVPPRRQKLHLQSRPANAVTSSRQDTVNTNTGTSLPVKNDGRRQFRAVTDGRLDLI